jgi:hypothetical protein
MLVLLLGLGRVLSAQQQQRDENALRRLPERERRALYEHSVHALGELCRGVGSGLMAEYCEQQAAFVVRLPECDEGCRRLAAAHLVRPTR